MIRCLALFLASSLAFPILVLAQDRPVAALGRVAVLGEISEGQRQIIVNQIRSYLTDYYELISEDAYLAAEEEAFQSLEEEECTEEACVRLIQDFLQIDRLFVLQIIREEEVTQLTVTLFKGESRRDVQDICENCSIAQLYGQAQELVDRLVLKDRDDRALARGAAEPEAQPFVEEAAEEGPATWALWAGGLSLLGGAVLFASALTQADDAESKSAKANANNDAALYSSAESDADEAEQNGAIGLAAVGIGVGLLVYYFMSGPDEEATAIHFDPTTGSYLAGPLSIEVLPQGMTLGYALHW